MEVKLLTSWEKVEKYIDKVENGVNCDEAWEDEVIKPFWDQLCCYAPFDMSDRKPKAVTDISKLREQVRLLKEIQCDVLQKEVNKITTALPNFDDDPITVVLFPVEDQENYLKLKQNGVVGSAVFGNMYIQINPFAKDYTKWIPYVFAHEYHHTVWGNYWFVMHGSELSKAFITSLVSDGEADSFAMSMYPELKPEWIFQIPEEEVERLWETCYKELASLENVDYVSYMFGNESKDIPWCCGYAIGYRVVQKYLQKKGTTVIEELKTKPQDFLKI